MIKHSDRCAEGSVRADKMISISDMAVMKTTIVFLCLSCSSHRTCLAPQNNAVCLMANMPWLAHKDELLLL